MRITRRTKAIAFFITLGSVLVGIAIFLNITWIVLNWREVVPLVLGIIFFGVIIAGVVLNTIFLVREVRRNEQQDSFLNAVTHELKTPITSLRLYLQTLERRQLDDNKRRDFYRLMLEDTDRLLSTVDQVLQASEVRQRSGKNNWQDVDFAAIVQESVELAQIRHALSPEEFGFGRKAQGQITLMGNPEELRTAVANLLENAIKYTKPPRKIVIDLLSPDMDTVLLSVRDNGPGIAKPELKRIFKRFYRVYSRGQEQVKGTGLGLFIVRSIVRRHGGDAWAESEGPGNGSTFWIRLPRVYHV
ncbi:MAG TPA: HAMP domain-containing sensor histidine kinase [Candidatus Limnocylindrales bacterium]|jgi:signal transduction histidine kinase|nr:HAMP domain-containing sensor histidine kinase [Candidatus Limnocylindrales bacterium]